LLNYLLLEEISDLPTMPLNVKPAKLREAQLQLQRKLQQREHIKDQKRRHLDTIIQVYVILFPKSLYEKRDANNLYFFFFYFLDIQSFI